MNKSSETIDRPNASFARTFLPITQANHPTGEMYYDPAVLEREKQVIFGQDWLCIGRAEEIPNVGDYKALRIVEQPILLCRTADGAITAYSNTCLHRGVEIASGAGKPLGAESAVAAKTRLLDHGADHARHDQSGCDGEWRIHRQVGARVGGHC